MRYGVQKVFFFLLDLLQLKAELESDSVTCVLNLDECPNNKNKHGDGFCDDDMNIAICDYDGGDCCQAKVVTYFCFKCECINSGCKEQDSKS